jgi:hypothetical protein
MPLSTARFTALGLLALGLVGLSAGSPLAASAASTTSDRHVLLISIDGMHQSDLVQWTSTHPQSVLADLSKEGVVYTNAFTTAPSDSFPGLLSMVTGGTPKSTGVFYDNSYTRTFFAPDNTTCSGPRGTNTVYDESIDRTDASGNIPRFTSIDPGKLPRAMVGQVCTSVYPHTFLQVNTIFNVADNSALYTAWSDKHPAYEIVDGPSDDGVRDLFTPEINAANDPTTKSVKATNAYDEIKVHAILNEINGLRSDGSRKAPVPAIFGMNFQSVSVAEKLVDPVLSCQRNPDPATCDPNYFPGAYQPGTFVFTPQMLQGMQYVDRAVGTMVQQLRMNGLLANTEIIVSAKHGQSPIDPSKLAKVGDTVTPVLTSAGIGVAQNTEDDVSLIWLSDQQQTGAAVAALESNKANGNSARIQYILSGAALADIFGNPLQNARTPDIIIQPIPGTIYSTSVAKVAEHGGFSEDDRHVVMVVVDGSATSAGARIVSDQVHTAQIAPTILEYLGLNPQLLRSVNEEHTAPLPRPS